MHVVSCLSHVLLFVTPCTAVAHQIPLSKGFSRREYWNGLPCPSPGDLPDPGTEPTTLRSPALAGGFFTTSAAWEAPRNTYWKNKNNFYILKYHDGGALVAKSCATLVSPWTVALQAPLPMGFLRHETEVGCHFLLN